MTTVHGQTWLKASATGAVMAALDAAGGEDCARFVGGCIRNALIGCPVDDIDIATVLKPEQTVQALKAAGLRAVPTGIAHGTVTAVVESRPFEITTLRRDLSTDGRKATVAFTDDWAEDAARRDFRLNALYANARGEVFDPTGHGVADALAGRIIFVGRPETRIREDYLRILRFFRFHAWYGRGEPDPEGLDACASLAVGMTRLSAERISRELMKLLAAPDPRVAVRAMAVTGVLAQVLPDAVADPLEVGAALTIDPVQRLGLLLPADEEELRRLSGVLRLPNAVRDRLINAAAALPDVSLTLSDAAARAALYRHGRQAFLDASLRRRVEASGEGAEQLAALAESWEPPSLPVGGRDLARLGVMPGPDTGRLLKAFEEEWIAADFPTSGHVERLERLVRGA